MDDQSGGEEEGWKCPNTKCGEGTGTTWVKYYPQCEELRASQRKAPQTKSVSSREDPSPNDGARNPSGISVHSGERTEHSEVSLLLV